MSNQIIQNKTLNSLDNIPVEIFKWGYSPDHYKIDMPHKHAFDELMFFESGGGTHEIDFQEYKIESKSIHFVPAGKMHFLKKDKDLKGFTIAFDSAFLDSNEYHKFSRNIFSEHYALNLGSSSFESLLDQTKLLVKYIENKNHFYQKKCYLMTLDLLFNNLIHEVNLILPSLDIQSEDPVLHEFKNLLIDNVRNQNKIAWYARCLNISPNILCDRVKNSTGIRAKQFLMNELIVSVKKELLNTSKSIKELSLDHGYDPSALGKIFKKQVGYTMKEYSSHDSRTK